jgi:hypothetical protein
MRILLFCLGVVMGAVHCTPKSQLPFGERLITFGLNDAPAMENAYAALAMQYRLNAKEQVIDSAWVYYFPQTAPPANDWMSRVYALKQGERKRWDFSESMKVDTLLDNSAPEVAYVDVEVLHCFRDAEALGNHWMDRAQTHDWEEAEIVKWYDATQVYEKRKGLKWKKYAVPPNTGLPLKKGDKVRTIISAHLLNGKTIGSAICVDATVGMPDQWIPAIQWVMPHLCYGDSVTVISESQYCFGKQGIPGLKIPPGVPIIFQIGVHVVPVSFVTLWDDRFESK